MQRVDKHRETVDEKEKERTGQCRKIRGSWQILIGLRQMRRKARKKRLPRDIGLLWSGLQEAVSAVFRDFAALRDVDIRARFAGGETGPEGVYEMEMVGYINRLKDCDAAMQQTLFMRELAASQQEGFRIKSFEYSEYPTLRFIGVNMDTKGHRPGQAEVEMVRILGQNVLIPYPNKYWTAEVFFDEIEKNNCTGMLFCVI